MNPKKKWFGNKLQEIAIDLAVAMHCTRQKLTPAGNWKPKPLDYALSFFDKELFFWVSVSQVLVPLFQSVVDDAVEWALTSTLPDRRPKTQPVSQRGESLKRGQSCDHFFVARKTECSESYFFFFSLKHSLLIFEKLCKTLICEWNRFLEGTDQLRICVFKQLLSRFSWPVVPLAKRSMSDFLWSLN